jgi:hypothetical protein
MLIILPCIYPIEKHVKKDVGGHWKNPKKNVSKATRGT